MKALAHWPPLHDGVIDSIVIEWPGPICRVLLGTSDYERLAIVGMDTRLVTCPQSRPWGHSHDLYVNEARLTNTNEGLARLEIETQEGDLIVIEAAEISIGVNDGEK